ncbi:hypothetical protein ACFLTU_06295 [Bacteroidota bacterium]
MNIRALPICFLLIATMLFSCDPWTLEKRPDHDFVTFVTTIQDNADKESWGILYDNGGYIVVGTSEETGSGNPDVYLVKVDEQGVKQWHSSFGDSDPEQGTAIIKLSDNQGYALAGNKNVSGNDWQIYLVKADLQGNKIWEERYGWSKEDKAYSLVQQQDGGFLLNGHSLTWEAAMLGTEAVIYKTLANGEEQTRYNFGNPVENGNDLDDHGHSIIRSGDGHFILLATYEDKNLSETYNIHLLKLDGSTLDILWDETIIENCFRINASFLKLSDGYAVLGASTNNKLSLVRINNEGISQWERSYDNSDCSLGASICQTQDNGFLILSSGMTLIKTDGRGLESERTDFNGEVHGNRCVIQASDGGYVFSGVFENSSSGLKELKIIKMYPDLRNAAPDI